MQNVLDIPFFFARGYSERTRTFLCNLAFFIECEHFLKGNSMLKAAQPKKIE